jgi:glycosyltransferase involved in cell wall biosynthesis
VVNVFSPDWNPCDSYGRKASELRGHLLKRGVPVNAFGLNAPKAMIRPGAGGIVLGYPTNTSTFGVLPALGRRVMVTAWESTKVPPGWVEQMNQYDAVSVGSTFVRNVFKAEGVIRPIHVHPLGVGAAYKPWARDGQRPFTFLAFTDRDQRKGGHYAIQAFARAFGEDPRYRLILKSRAGKPPFPLRNANMEVLAADLSESELAALYTRCDALIFPTMGEGFGLPPREFAATGGISIVTNWGGTADDLPHWGIPVGWRPVKAWTSERYKSFKGLDLGDWAEPDMDQLVMLLRWLSAVPLATRNALGEQFAENARRLYSWERFAHSVYEVWHGDSDSHRCAPQSNAVCVTA